MNKQEHQAKHAQEDRQTSIRSQVDEAARKLISLLSESVPISIERGDFALENFEAMRERAYARLENIDSLQNVLVAARTRVYVTERNTMNLLEASTELARQKAIIALLQTAYPEHTNIRVRNGERTFLTATFNPYRETWLNVSEDGTVTRKDPSSREWFEIGKIDIGGIYPR